MICGGMEGCGGGIVKPSDSRTLCTGGGGVGEGASK